MAITEKQLRAKIQSVKDQKEVYDSDLKASEDRELAIDGLTHYVFNTLRGTQDTFEGATFDQVRKIVSETV